MPYFNHIMARSIQKSMGSLSKEEGPAVPSGTSAPVSNRKTRSLPGNDTKGSASIYQRVEKDLASKYRVKMKQRKILFFQSLLRAQVGQMMSSETKATYAVDAYPAAFRSFKMDTKIVRHSSGRLRVYPAKSANRPEVGMAAWVYSRTDVDPDTSVHLKILRHLAYKHPYIIHTFELFSDKTSVYVFQEWSTWGNLIDYMERVKEPLGERKAAIWAKQIYRALDFLGDQAIAHRDLSAIHLVVQPQTKTEAYLKLTGFSKAIIYWDVVTNDIQFCKCLPLERQREDGPNFQPPEVYGNAETEQFDPIQADIWSYGANVYYMLVKQYPFNVLDPSEDIDGEIQHNIEKLSSLSQEARNFLFALLRGNSNNRMPFDFIETHPWLRSNAKTSIRKVAKQTSSGKQLKVAPASESPAKGSNGASSSAADSSATSGSKDVKLTGQAEAKEK